MFPPAPCRQGPRSQWTWPDAMPYREPLADHATACRHAIIGLPPPTPSSPIYVSIHVYVYIYIYIRRNCPFVAEGPVSSEALVGTFDQDDECEEAYMRCCEDMLCDV